jgi:hypothetical protein
MVGTKTLASNIPAHFAFKYMSIYFDAPQAIRAGYNSAMPVAHQAKALDARKSFTHSDRNISKSQANHSAVKFELHFHALVIPNRSGAK